MTYNFWNKFKKVVPYDIAIKFDVRLCNVEHKINDFFQTVLTQTQNKKIVFFLAGSCIKADTFRDIDFIFPKKEQMEALNALLDQNYFKYQNNSYTYEFDNEIFQLVFREKFKDATLGYLVDNFDFDSTKIAFVCELDLNSKTVKIEQSDIRHEFIHYVQTKQNNLHKVNVNPFVSLQRAIHFLKRGDDVPYAVFLEICSKIAELKIEAGDDKEKFFDRLQGDKKKLKDIKHAISQFVDVKKEKSGE